MQFLKHFSITLFISFFWVANLMAQLEAEPNSYQFSPRQTGTVSEEEAIFTITNAGTDAENLDPEQINIQGAQAQSTHLTIMTYNIWYDSQNWTLRLNHILSQIREADPDIIGLQEVIQRANLDNQAQTIADSLGYYYYFSSVDPPENDQRFGNAIISRYPFEETNWRALQPLNDYRTAVHAKININGNIIDFYNTHLHNTAVNDQIREQQMTDLLDLIEQTSDNQFVFVTGDFNANPDWQEMDIMYEDFTDVYPLFHENHSDPEHSTLNHHLGHQQRRIDYIFFLQESSVLLQPTSAEIFLDEPDENGAYGSDHFAVKASFNIRSDANGFLLNNIPTNMTLEAGESTQLGVQFAPFTTGSFEAVLKIKEMDIPLSGESFDATISDFPWTEDFTGSVEMPVGWETNTSSWGIENSDLAGGNVPELVFTPDQQENGIFTLKTPHIKTSGLDSMELSFRQTVSYSNTSGPYTFKLVAIADNQEFIIEDWSYPEQIPNGEYAVKINSQEHGIGADIVQLAWIFEGDPADINHWAQDDIVLTAGPALAADPPEHIFEAQQINNASPPQAFVLQNIGGGTLSLSQEDVFLEGAHKDDFLLNNLSSAVELGHGETAEVSVIFQPLSTGTKTVSLITPGENIEMEGEGYDPAITSFPWKEDFTGVSGGEIPLGWYRNAVNWGVFNASNAGGQAPEMVFWWQPETQGEFILYSPPIVPGTTDSLLLSFRHRVNDFASPGNYTLRVTAIAGDTETLIHQWVDPSSIAPEVITSLLTKQLHWANNDTLQLAYTFDGITDNITQWDIDDIELMLLPDEPLLETDPESFGFGAQTIGSSSDPAPFIIRNTGGGTLSLKPEDIFISGENEGAFFLDNIEDTRELGPFEETTIEVSFAPQQTGDNTATLHIQEAEVGLSGFGNQDSDIFVYSDFTISEGGMDYTNVEGFREIPGWAAGSLVAEDVEGMGENGGTVLKLDYDLNATEDITSYWMWAYPSTDISDYTHMVLYMRAEENTTGLKIQLFDTSGIQETNGAGYFYTEASTEWQWVSIPISEFNTMEWADDLPDMSKIQRIDLVFEKEGTTPTAGTVFLDLVGFSQGGTNLEDLIADQHFQLFPNPASRKVTIVSNEDVLISISDISGKTLMEKISKRETTQFDLASLKEGVYLVTVSDGHNRTVKKLIIQ